MKDETQNKSVLKKPNPPVLIKKANNSKKATKDASRKRCPAQPSKKKVVPNKKPAKRDSSEDSDTDNKTGKSTPIAERLNKLKRKVN